MDFLSALEFRQPWFLLAALLAVPTYLLARRPGGHILFSSLGLLPSKTGSWRSALAWIPDAMIAAAVVALAIALAGPRVGDERDKIEREGIAIMMVVDTSSSMRALDLSASDKEMTRLDAVIGVFKEFVNGGDDLKGRPNDTIGLVSFAGFADTRCPLTLDHGNLTAIASELKIVDERSEDGTAMGDGLGLAIERLRRSSAKSKVAILLTDGVNNAGEETPLAAAKLAKTKGVRVYTVGAGTNGLAPMRIRDPFSGRMVLRPVPVEIDEKTLEAIAAETDGHYFRATDADGLRAVYRQIDQLERIKQSEDRFVRYDEHFSFAVALGLLLAMLGWLGRGTLFRRLP